MRTVSGPRAQNTLYNHGQKVIPAVVHRRDPAEPPSSGYRAAQKASQGERRVWAVQAKEIQGATSLITVTVPGRKSAAYSSSSHPSAMVEHLSVLPAVRFPTTAHMPQLRPRRTKSPLTLNT